MTRRCNDCGDITLVSDLDSPAICPGCVRDRRSDELQLVAEIEQIGAQFIGRERGTRDDRGLG